MTTAAGTMTAAAMTEDLPPRDGRPRTGLRRRLFGDVRARIIASYVVLLAISGTATVLIVRQVAFARVNDRVDADLVQEAGEFRRLAGGIDPRTGEPFAGDVDRIFTVFLKRNIPSENEQLITLPVAGEPVFRDSVPGSPMPPDELIGQWRALTASARGEVETEAGPARYLATPVIVGERTVGTFGVVHYLEADRRLASDSVRTVATVAAIILLGGTAAAFLIVGRVLAPLREFRDAARSVSGSDMTKRIEVRGEDELAELGSTFNRMLDRLELAFSTQREFIRDAGHELRTPIAIIRGHLELLAEQDSGHDDPQRRETFELLDGELDRMTRFVNDMLLLAKAERPDFLRLETVRLDDLCEELLAKAEALGERRWSVSGAPAATIVADRQRLTQAVMNLASNAVASSLPGDEISIGARTTGSDALVWVADTGRGIDPAEQVTILEPFRRGRGARYEGSGLGLSIVAAIAAAHGGSMEIESELGTGTTVTLRLPVEGPSIEVDGEGGRR